MHPSLKRKDLAACLNRLKDTKITVADVLNDAEFMYYHLNRNFFNNKYGHANGNGRELTYLKKSAAGDYFTDNMEGTWVEMSFDGAQWNKSSVADRKEIIEPGKKQGIRRFYSNDDYMTLAGYEECEFVLHIKDGKRITTGIDMEIYRFGIFGTGDAHKSSDLHRKFDVAPHNANPNYITSYYPSSSISIME